MKTVKLALELMTIDQMKADPARSYNASEWVRKIDRYAKFDGVQFYKVPAGDGYDYDRFFVRYTLPEGFAVFSQFSYHSIMSDSGFRRVEIDLDNGAIRVFGFGPCRTKAAANTPENRKIFAHNTKVDNHIYSTEF